jgi:hypothetical protein
MKSSAKLLLGIFTFLPLVLFIFLVGFFFNVILENIIELEQHQGEFSVAFIQSLLWVFVFIIPIALISLAIKIYYIVHTNNNQENDTTKKIMWTLILIFGGTIAAIIYYFIEIIPLKQPT